MPSNRPASTGNGKNTITLVLLLLILSKDSLKVINNGVNRQTHTQTQTQTMLLHLTEFTEATNVAKHWWQKQTQAFAVYFTYLYYKHYILFNVACFNCNSIFVLKSFTVVHCMQLSGNTFHLSTVLFEKTCFVISNRLHLLNNFLLWPHLYQVGLPINDSL